MLLSSQSVAIREVRKKQHMLLVWFRRNTFSCYMKIPNLSGCGDFVACLMADFHDFLGYVRQ